MIITRIVTAIPPYSMYLSSFSLFSMYFIVVFESLSEPKIPVSRFRVLDSRSRCSRKLCSILTPDPNKSSTPR